MLFIINFLSYILTYITSKKILIFSFWNINYPIFSRNFFSNIIAMNFPRPNAIVGMRLDRVLKSLDHLEFDN